MAINNRDRNNTRQRTRTVFVPVNVGGGGGTQEKIKVGESGLKLAMSTFAEVPDIFDFSDVTNMSYMFNACFNLQSAPLIDTSQVDSVPFMFNLCDKLQSVPEYDWTAVTGTSNTFKSCTSLTDLGGFIGLKANLDLSSCPLTHDSIMNVINKAADVTASPKTLTLGSTNLAKLTEAQIAVATNKGWTLA